MQGKVQRSLLVLLVAGVVSAAEQGGAKPDALSPQQIGEGWILLFDGQTTFGWKTEGNAKVAGGGLVLADGAAAETTTEFGSFELRFEYQGAGAGITLGGETADLPDSSGKEWIEAVWKIEARDSSVRTSHAFKSAGKPVGRAQMGTRPTATRAKIAFHAGRQGTLVLRNVRLRPLGLMSIFNGKDLTGWSVLPGHKSVFTVTDKGELNVRNGNGDLQSEGQWQDLILQLDVFSNGKHLNSGIFFRALPGEFWQGYEAQVRNQWEGDDRTKPVDFGTGGLYNLQKSRKVVSSDKQWFTYTIIAHGRHIALWVNGYPTADHVDTREPAPSARKGSMVGKGCITLQGHDPTTDLSFRNIRVTELPKPAAADTEPAKPAADDTESAKPAAAK